MPLIDAVDDQDRVVGRVARTEVFSRQANFRVVHAFLFNADGDVLLQKLPDDHVRHPSYWGSSVAGYVHSGESYEEAVRRRSRQELGLDALDLHFFVKAAMDDEGCRKFAALYVGPCYEPVMPDLSHIAAVEFLPVAGIVAEHAEHRRRFTPTFLYLFEKYLSMRRQ